MLAQLLLLLSEVDFCTKTQVTTDNHEDVQCHISLGSVCTNHLRSTDIHLCSGSSVGKDQGNKVVAVEKMGGCQVWQVKERYIQLSHRELSLSRRESCNSRLIYDEKQVNLESSRITFLRISREIHISRHSSPKFEKCNSRINPSISLSRLIREMYFSNSTSFSSFSSHSHIENWKTLLFGELVLLEVTGWSTFVVALFTAEWLLSTVN